MIEEYPDGPALAAAAACGVAEQLAAGLATRPRASLAATGGRSPGRTYEALRDAPLDWARVVVTLSDERCVPPGAPEANARLVREGLLVGPAARAHFLPLWPSPPPEALAAIQPFDAVLLGMGEDGHVASLLPGDPGLTETLDPGGETRIAQVPAGLGSPPVARITLTLSALLDARAIFLLIAGGAKREVAERALSGEDLPVRRILAQTATPVRVLWAPDFER